MEVKILQEDKDVIELELEGETHTLTNLIRKELWNNKNTVFASYNLKHPLVSHPILKVQTKSKPKKVILETIDDIKNQIKELREKIKKL